MKFDPESFLNDRFVGEGGWTLGGERGWTLWGRGGGHNRGEVNKIVVDNSKMVMCCQRTARTCEGNGNRKILMLPQQSLNSGIGKDRKLTAAKATLLCSLTSRTTQFSGWGKGNVAQNKDNFTRGTEGKLCYVKSGL